MNVPKAFRSGGFAAAACTACTACCAPPIIAALGLTAGLAATAGVFLGLTAAVAVVLLGAGWVIRKRTQPTTSTCMSTNNSQPASLAAPHNIKSASTCCDSGACATTT